MITIICKECQAASRVNKWHCPCNIPWFSCSQHAPIGLNQKKCTTNRTTTDSTLQHQSYLPLGAKRRASTPVAHVRTTPTPQGSQSTSSSTNHVPNQSAPAPDKPKASAAARRLTELGKPSPPPVSRKRALSHAALRSQTERLVNAWARRKLEQQDSKQVDGMFTQSEGRGGVPCPPINLNNASTNHVT